MSEDFSEDRSASRHKIIHGLSRRFIQETYAAIEDTPPVLALDIVNHLLEMLLLLEEYSASEEDSVSERFFQGEERFIRKWGRLLKPYRKQHFEVYFQPEVLLTDKGIISLDEFNELPSEEKYATKIELAQFIKFVQRFLEATQYQLLIEQPPSDEAMQALSKDPSVADRIDNLLLGENAGGSDPKSNKHKKDRQEEEIEPEQGRAFGNTKTRSRLALYFLVKAAGVEPRTGSAVSALAKLAHFITGEKLTTLNNSNTYKFYLQMPDYKTAKGRLEDLNFIRPFFEELGMNKALDLIDSEIVRANAALPRKAGK